MVQGESFWILYNIGVEGILEMLIQALLHLKWLWPFLSHVAKGLPCGLPLSIVLKFQMESRAQFIYPAPEVLVSACFTVSACFSFLLNRNSTLSSYAGRSRIFFLLWAWGNTSVVLTCSFPSYYQWKEYFLYITGKYLWFELIQLHSWYTEYGATKKQELSVFGI